MEPVEPVQPVQPDRETRELTADEAAFARELAALRSGLELWVHEDAGGTPWLLVSLDLVPPGTHHIVATWRVDVDRAGAVGGLSPGFLNWDDGVRARDAGIDVEGPRGLVLGPTDDLPARVARWFDAREVDGWPVEREP